MVFRGHCWACIAVVFSTSISSPPSSADEGMWLFEDLPVEYLKSRYDFAPTEAWADHVRLSSVRFNSGGSASFVSSDGLVLTNHHVAADTLHKLSSPEHNYAEDGFLARTRDDEIKTPDLELNQLVSIEDVTESVNQSVTSGMSPTDASKARQAAMAKLEKTSLDKTGLRSDVITLYGGAKYHLYRFKKYTDVRLVWAPEAKAAFFGGDADNFEYPRYCLDVTLFRVYENGKPAQIEHFLKYSERGAAEGELIFVSGNPGRTQRIFTVDALKYLRDHRMPYVLDLLRRREVLLQQFGLEGKEQERRCRDELFGIQNARKAYTGMLQGLQNPEFLAQKAKQETDLLAKVRSRDDIKQAAQAWDTIRQTQERKADLLGKPASFARMSRLYAIAEDLVLMAAEDMKPSGDRLREYRDSARESFEQQLFSPAPIYNDFEQVKLTDAIAAFIEKRGGDDPLVAQVLQGKSPRERATELIKGTKLGEVETRRLMAKDGVNESDPMIQLAKVMDADYRALREVDEELTEIERQAYAKINEATVAVQGTSTYPDATFSLRLAFGTVKGYEEDGTAIAPWTDIRGAFEHQQNHESKGDWVLPQSWHDRRSKLNLDAPLNFVCTADIIGGNSGSPVINKEAELVGVIFDGNIQSLTSDFFYSDKVGRAVCVHSEGIREALKNIYGATALAAELGK